MFRRPFFLLALAPTALIAAGCSNATRINGGGASFVYPLMLMWTKAYDDQFHVQIDYQLTGSGNGQQQTIAKTIDFGCSDVPVSDANLKKAESIGGRLVHIPLVMGAVVPIYNIEGIDDDLHFTGEIMARMYLGTIVYWDDPSIEAINRGLKLPHERINLGRRADASGTTAIFTDFLAKTAPNDWSEQMTGASPGWPKAVQIVGMRGNEGVAGFVRRTSNSFGYVELIYARQNQLKCGAVKNRHGRFISASLESVTAAADASREEIVKEHPDLRYSLTDALGENAYPISGTNWAILYEKQPSHPGKELVEFLRWATKYGGEGQKYARKLGYAPLPEWLTKEVNKKFDAIEFVD